MYYVHNKRPNFCPNCAASLWRSRPRPIRKNLNGQSLLPKHKNLIYLSIKINNHV